jgi:DNA topoisomerase-1
MKKSFPVIVDLTFTANLESLLDKIEEGVIPWKTVVRNFYPDLEEAVKNAEKELSKYTIEDEVTEVVCDNCGKNMVVKYGPFGKFLACPGFPECRNTKPHFEKTGIPCPKCNSEIVIKKTKKGRMYYGCETTRNVILCHGKNHIEKKCPECGEVLLEKGTKAVCSNDNCAFTENISKN